ncbi:MAG TPA: hypothetical protein VGQ46_05145 [Thermoanaerobaculia bacterium]|jgi:hypothetical protein|nr:hypothetical protein [Thermoanaerobaculia bacterium]
MSHCWNGHGDYDGYECPTCAQIEATREAGETAAEAARDAADRAERSAALQLAEAQRLAEQAEQAHREALQAQYETQEAIQRASDQNRRLVRDGWKLQVESKVQRAVELLNNDMSSESAAILRDALAADPGNLFVHIYLALAELQGGNAADYWLHLQKGIQLLGTSDYSTVLAYRETTKVFVVPSAGDEETNESRQIRELLFKKLRTYLTSQPGDIDMHLLEAIAEKGWDDLARLSVAAIDPSRLSLAYVETALDHHCNEAALFAASVMVESGAAKKDAPTWLQGALTAWQVKHRIGLGAPENSLRLLAAWNIDEVGGLIELFASNYDAMKRSFTEPAWTSFGAQFKSYYKDIRKTVYEHIDRKARAISESSQFSGAGIGCLLAFVTFFLLAIVANVLHTSESGPFIIFIVLAATVAGFGGAKLQKTSNRQKVFNERQSHFRSLQEQIERAIGFMAPPPAPAVAMAVDDTGSS